MRTLRQFLHFHGVGAAGALVNLGTLYVVYDVVGLFLYASLMVSFSIAVVFNFVVIKTWTFRDSRWELGYALQQFAQFYAIATAGLCLSLGAFYVMHELVALDVYISQALAIAIAAPFHFFVNRRVTFRRRLRANSIGCPSEGD